MTPFRTRAGAVLAGCLLAAMMTATVVGAQPQAGSEAEPAPTANPFATEQRLPVLLDAAARAYEAEDYLVMRQAASRAAELRPQLVDLQYLLARAHALLDEKSEAYNALVELQSQGMSFDMDGDPDFENLRGFQLYDYLQDEFAKNGTAYGQASRYGTIERTDLLLESMVWDSAGERLLVGSVITGEIFAVGDDGELETLVTPDEENGLLGITSLAVDARNNTLWVASADTPQTRNISDEQRGASILHRFELDTGRFLERLEAPVRPLLFIDLALAPNGDVYLADAIKPVIWKAASEGDEAGQLVPFFGGGGLTGVRSIELDSAGRNLYLADYEIGVLGIALADQSLFPVQLGRSLILSGVDAMHWYKDSLIVVQNGTWPRRVLRVGFFPDRKRAQHAQALESNHPEFRNPVAGTLGADGRFLLIANSHRGTYDPRTGAPIDGAEREPPVILSIDPEFGWKPPPLKLGPILESE